MNKGKNKGQRQKRDKLILLGVGTLALAGMIWVSMIQPELTQSKLTRNAIKDFADKLSLAERHVQRSEQYKRDLQAAQKRLGRIESKMATGDIYRWLIRVFPSSESSNAVEITAVEPPQVADCLILPRLPYKSAVFSITGVGYYEDVGIFLARVENSYPHMRLRHLEIEPTHVGNALSEEDEKLVFKMEMMALIKPTAAGSLPNAERR